MANKVVITGLGVISPIGDTVEEYWSGLLQRQSVPEESPRVKPEYMKNRRFYAVRDQAAAGSGGERDGRGTRFALRAAEMALADAGLLASEDAGVIGVSLGNAMGDSDLLEAEREGGARVSPSRTCFFRAAAALAERFHLNGPNLSISTACSAGGYSIGLAREAILEGWADVMLVGGTEGFTRIAMACFNRMGALDPQVCRPFDTERAGTVFGEGAAILVLESEQHARRRRRAYAEVKGCGWSCDGHHPTAPEPGGGQAELAVRRALAEADLAPDAIDCVVPHGTGTELNDLMESACLERVFGASLGRVLVSAIKSKIGHGGGAAGAFSCLTAALILDRGVVPPTGHLKTVDPRCAIRPHADGPVQAPVRNVLVNAYAFGGNNISLVLGRAES